MATQNVPELTLGTVQRSEGLHASATSEVFGARMHTDGSRVVVKRTKITSANDIRRFETELELLQCSQHERIVRVLGVMRAPPTYALVLPHYSHGALFALLHASGCTLEKRSKAVIILDVAIAIAHLHSVGVLHRDIKSDNVLIGDDGRAVLTDFNAAELESRITSDIVLQVESIPCSRSLSQ